MIVGFEIERNDIQGKFKLSQNRSIKDQKSVIQRLSQSQSRREVVLARLMEGNINDPKP